jgi:acetylornithine/succinyldiaminopimelate/putrescine aminotransferase
VADLFKGGFALLQEKHPGILVEVRQRGLMMGLKLASDQLGPLMTLAGFRHGLLTIYANHDQSVNQLLPPLTIQEEQVQPVLETLDRMLTWMEQAVSNGMSA